MVIHNHSDIFTINKTVVIIEENGSLLHLEFQTSKEPTLYRLMAYDVALAEHIVQKLRTIMLYTENINEGPTTLDIRTATYQVENIYLNRLSGVEIPDPTEQEYVTALI